MPCCRCNNSGRCRNCSCSKSGKKCFNCVPCRLNRCENICQVNSSADLIPITSDDPSNTHIIVSSSNLAVVPTSHSTTVPHNISVTVPSNASVITVPPRNPSITVPSSNHTFALTGKHGNPPIIPHINVPLSNSITVPPCNPAIVPPSHDVIVPPSHATISPSKSITMSHSHPVTVNCNPVIVPSSHDTTISPRSPATVSSSNSTFVQPTMSHSHPVTVNCNPIIAPPNHDITVTPTDTGTSRNSIFVQPNNQVHTQCDATLPKMSNPDFTFGDLDGESFVQSVRSAYSEARHWQKNLFELPLGKDSALFIKEMAHLFGEYANASSMECIALTAAMLMPMIILQKPFKKSKPKDHQNCLKRRMQLWLKGNINELMIEGRTIQMKLKKTTTPHLSSDDTLAHKFAQFMKKGNIKAALRLLDMQQKGGPLNAEQKIDDTSEETVLETLIKKHPEARSAHPSTLENQAHHTAPHPVVFEAINGQLIRSLAMNMKGAGGPSGLDSIAWRHMCSQYKEASEDLCNSLANVARRISTCHVNPSGLEAMLTCRLIALDKCPGVRPIGIGETSRRIISKAILSIIKDDIQEAVGALQLCAGQTSGCEAAISALQNLFDEDFSEACLFVDASNAFNNMNRQVAFHTIQRLCPSLSVAFTNTYCMPSNLVIGKHTILSQEGTTQGDPLSMAIYAIALRPLIDHLHGLSKQIWYADDASAVDKLQPLRKWWDKLVEVGPRYGYFPNALKSVLLVKSTFHDKATSIFKNTNVIIQTEGHPYLGIPIGSHSFCQKYLHDLVNTWSQEIKTLSKIAHTQPQAAYVGFTKGLINKWTYVMRSCHTNDITWAALEDTIRHHFLPALTGRKAFSDLERKLLSLPPRHGGIGIIIPNETAKQQYAYSDEITSSLVLLIMTQNPSYSDETRVSIAEAMRNVNSLKKEAHRNLTDSIMNDAPRDLQLAINLAKEKGASNWLTVLPIQRHGYCLHKSAFRDALSLRYGWTPSGLPTTCVCGKAFSVEHAISCKCGGFVIGRHNEVRNIIADVMSEVCQNVEIEPQLQPLSGESLRPRSAIHSDEARLDIKADGFWGGHGQCTFFDVRVLNPYAPSNRTTSVDKCYIRHEREKRRSYEERIREVELSSFTPLVFTTTGGAGPTATQMLKRLAALIADRRGLKFNMTMNWIRSQLSFSLLRSSINAIRGRRMGTKALRHNPELALCEGSPRH